MARVKTPEELLAEQLGEVDPVAAGLKTPGNIKNLYDRKVLNNPDGSYSTTSSASFGFPEGETLLPTVIDGRRLSDEEAIQHYRQTGEHLGIFDTPENADNYAQRLHTTQERNGARRALAPNIPEPTANIADPVKNNYNDQTAQRYAHQADTLDQQAQIPAAKPHGVKENLVVALRGLMEGMSNPNDPYAMQKRREDQDTLARRQLVEQAKALRDDSARQQQLAQGERQQTFAEREAARKAAEPVVNNLGQGSIAQTPRAGGTTTFEHDPNFSKPGPQLQETTIMVNGKPERWAVDMTTGTPHNKIGDAQPPATVVNGTTVYRTNPETGLDEAGVRKGDTFIPLKDAQGNTIQGPAAGRAMARADISATVDAAGAQNLYNRMKNTLDRIESGQSSAVGADDEALLAMHLSMTMGQVKGARTGRDVIDAHRNAIDPASRLGRIVSNVETGAGLTPEQRHEFVALAQRQVESMKEKRGDIHDFYTNTETPPAAPPASNRASQFKVLR